MFHLEIRGKESLLLFCSILVKVVCVSVIGRLESTSPYEQSVRADGMLVSKLLN